jgi:hypothetical protein
MILFFASVSHVVWLMWSQPTIQITPCGPLSPHDLDSLYMVEAITMIRKTASLLTILSTLLIHTTTIIPDCLGQVKTGANPSSQLADLSGLAWVEGDKFIGVHDAKTDDAEMLKPRIAKLQLPKNLSGITHEDRRLTFHGTPPNDLESIAKIPSSTEYLLVESGDSMQDPSVQRIFKATLQDGQFKIVNQTQWPVKIHNVEGTAVAALGNTFVFVFAERADNQSSTDLCWITFNPVSMKFAKQVNRIKFQSPDPQRFNRVIVGLDIDSTGLIYSVSAFDAESAGLPNPDNGPYASGIYEIGRITMQNNTPKIQLHAKPIEHALVDGFKVESIAVRKTNTNARPQLFIGTDDENYGGTLRQLAQ